jgi:hypothetical protein
MTTVLSKRTTPMSSPHKTTTGARVARRKRPNSLPKAVDDANKAARLVGISMKMISMLDTPGKRFETCAKSNRPSMKLDTSEKLVAQSDG